MPSLQEHNWESDKGQPRYPIARQNLNHDIEKWIAIVIDIMTHLPEIDDEYANVELKADAKYLLEINLDFYGHLNEINSPYYNVLNKMNEGITSSARDIIKHAGKVSEFLEDCSRDLSIYRQTTAAQQIQPVLTTLKNLQFYCTQG